MSSAHSTADANGYFSRMLRGEVARPPVLTLLGSRIDAVDAQAALALPGVRGLVLTPRLASYTREARLRSAWGVARRLDEILRMKPAGDRVVTMPAELGDLVRPPMSGVISPGAAAATAASSASR